mmetsp:Transcript_19830/g.17525  ORF Transcript_19830/g.17525 Transcript_19830/m.17525 type:complete len:180 (+) Transcript_19830:423-962(+)
MKTCIPRGKGPEYYLVFRENRLDNLPKFMNKKYDTIYERFIEKTDLEDKKELSKGFVDFNRHSKRKPFVKESKNFGKAKNSRNHRRRFLTTSPENFFDPQINSIKKKKLKLYEKDRIMWDPCIKSIMQNNDLDYTPDKELTMKKLSGGVPAFNKMTNRVSLKSPLSQFTSINPKMPKTK